MCYVSGISKQQNVLTIDIVANLNRCTRKVYIINICQSKSTANYSRAAVFNVNQWQWFNTRRHWRIIYRTDIKCKRIRYRISINTTIAGAAVILHAEC